ncbi:MAG: hypothetical protein K2K57_08465 [Oscillospiraceae bacterium]|nr:hypothetical protein [Oscillospiraceae bacterium]
MNIKKTTAAILLVLTFSACSEADIANEETETAAAQTETSSTQTETTTTITEEESTADTTATEQMTAETTHTTEETPSETEEKRLSREEVYAYFAKEHYKFEFSTLYIDMNEHWDGQDPLAHIDKDYLKYMSNLYLENVGSRDLSFLEKYHFGGLTLERYSGNADFSLMDFKELVLDDYRGGDMTSVFNITSKKTSDPDWLRFTNYNGNENLSFLSHMDNITCLRFNYFDERTDFGFISDCPNIVSLFLKNERIDADNLAEVLKKSNIKNLGITVEEYSSEDAEFLMRTAHEYDSAVYYGNDDEPWDSRRDLQNHVFFFTNLFVDTEAAADWEDWDCRSNAHQIWKYHGSLINSFSNYTEEMQQINSVEILKNVKGTYTPIPFADGSLVYEIDFALGAGESSDFEITEEMFPFSKCKPGVYKIVFNSDSQRFEQPFAICSSDISFLTDEQQELLDKGCEITAQYFGCSTYMSQEYADTHTAEEFLENLYPAYTREYAYSKSLGTYIDKNGKLQAAFGDRGGDISVWDHFFMSLYSDEKEVLFKNFVIHGHTDDPYFIWFEEFTYHMVKTDEGWRFDKFQLWY